MSVPDPAAPRKPRRLGLYLPFVLLGVAILAWSCVWVWARREAETRLDRTAAALSGAGYQIAWKRREIGGYPFRLDVTLHEVSLREPSGWALAAPRLEAEAYMHAPGHWMFAAPQGLTFVRPIGGPVAVSGGPIHGALWALDRAPPSLDLVGEKLAFQPAAGANPFFLSAAQRLELHLRAGPDDEGGLFFTVDGGRAQLSGLFARIAGDKPISIVWNATLSKMSAFQGASWAQAVRRWTAAGGRMIVRRGALAAGDAAVETTAGELAADADGRLAGHLDAALRQAPRALTMLGATGAIAPETAASAAAVAEARQDAAATARATLTFQAGRTTLGPVAIGPAPKIYDPRKSEQ